MRKIVLQPEQLLVPGEYELGSESILKIYFRVFDKGHGADLPPVIVARSDLTSSEDRMRELRQRVRWYTGWVTQGGTPDTAKEAADELIAAYENFISKTANAPYYLLDGNHKSAAATLTHNAISALELQSDADLVKVRSMIKRGELFNFNRSETSLSDLVHAFERYILGKDGAHPIDIEDLRTVKERIDKLVFDGQLPQYMRDRYRQSANQL